MAGAARLAKNLHTAHFGETVALLIVTLLTGTGHILPGVATAEAFRDHMIDCHRPLAVTAILTDMPVALDDIFAGQQNLFICSVREPRFP